jgi:hypothetical protein
MRMLPLLILLVVALVVVAAWKLLRPPAAGPPAASEADGAAVYHGLRSQVLEAAADLEIDLPAPGAAWGLLMETGFEEGAVTLVALRDRNASLYFSSGGGMIGGAAHGRVRRAAEEVVRAAERHRGAMQATEAFPLPALGRVRFYLLTGEGVLTFEAAEEELGNDRSALSPLFHAAHEVIAGLREVDESPGR